MKKGRVFLILLLAVLLNVFSFKISLAQTSQIDEGLSDAVAVRIVPNPNHYSIGRWYQKQGFQGSPQSLVVDGYEAIRDGRTVYVNAANVDENKNIYTNIYLISYNQSSSKKTVDILGQIISNWKFNSNLIDPNASPTCSMSALSCSNDNDCDSSQYCSNSGLASSSCLLKEPNNCITDQDCPVNLFCNSLKSKITRDIKRIAQIEELKEALAAYKKNNQKYPGLSAGTYLANHSISVWPSWSDAFLSGLSVAQNIIDPINRLGACPGFDAKTCWNKDQNTFFSNTSSGLLTLPAGSNVFSYSVNKNNTNFNLCAVIESKELGYNFSPEYSSSLNCTVSGLSASGQIANKPPVLVDYKLNGQTGKEFIGYIKVNDENKDALKWIIAWANGANTWGKNLPTIKDTSDPYQKKIYAPIAGIPGTHYINLIVKDGGNIDLFKTLPLTITSSVSSIEAEDISYTLNQQIPMNYSFSFLGSNFNNPELAYSVSKTSGPIDVLANLTKSFSNSGTDKYTVNYYGTFTPAIQLTQNSDFAYRIKITDKNNQITTKDFNVKINIVNPQLDFSCQDYVRINNGYSCLVTSASLPNLTVGGLPSGLAFDGTTISGQVGVAGTYPIITRLDNGYGNVSQKQLNLKVNNYCGDGTKQTPNTEGSGGLNNDGYENCDGGDGVTNNVSLSNVNLQYGCSTVAGEQTPFPILSNDRCVFKAATNNGGYCGDGICTHELDDGTILETCTNCGNDCGFCPITISGTVTSYAYNSGSNMYPSKPVANASVKILTDTNETAVSVITSNNGTYSAVLPANYISSTKTYILSVTANGFSTTKQQFIPSASKIVNAMVSAGGIDADRKISLSFPTANWVQAILYAKFKSGHDLLINENTSPSANPKNIPGTLFRYYTTNNWPYEYMLQNQNTAIEEIASVDTDSGSAGPGLINFRVSSSSLVTYSNNNVNFVNFYDYSVVKEPYDCNYSGFAIKIYDENNNLFKEYVGCNLKPASCVDDSWRPFKVSSSSEIINIPYDCAGTSATKPIETATDEENETKVD